MLAATTTHIRQPDHNMAHTEAECSALWAAGEYAVLGTPDGCGKLTAPPPDLLHRWIPQADAVFLEADGAKRMPCKAPASREPVLLPECDTVLAVAGLSALGRPLREVCFRLDEACALLHTAQDGRFMRCSTRRTTPPGGRWARRPGPSCGNDIMCKAF